MEIELADELLRDWYDWSRQWRPDLDMPHLAPYCREAKSAGGWEGDSDIMEESFHRNTMEAIDFCVNSLPPEYSLAIGLEMRKRRGAAREWRNGCRGVSYKMAVAAILPKLKAKYLI
ncbi:hypothetical protein [Oxalobacter formigenes]|uniref:Uncharacterized protein n=1 Tax=Oxalobacter formigenes OXCC13 TaxID=556269 RepID=C3X8Z5_OXAFO|nr:hypothetical protein [Oxalobacter formigenes]ARQ46271.1 hypothetical protein BRW83_1530 [Oxalobacter formigenes]ARQ78392.1 hypothetical protein BRW84_07045 [Oxalobacter formigenes OXCC13]EEO29671.1 hypothetical protein OFBG_00699 [Oxalobacter formigenes OXCC13]MCZ4063028.1 hypothetical protein [Oxalobacter formigenes]QDX33013.1 hypothetical protein FPZ51_05175 [Oxalobacter formigenes]